MDELSVKKRNNSRIVGTVSLFIVLVVGLFAFFKTSPFKHTYSQKLPHATAEKTESKQKVLGYSTPQLFISGGETGYSGGGMVSLASTDEPAVNIGSYNVTGKVDVAIYEANEQMLLDYLTHNKDGEQTKNPDVSSLKQLGTATITIAETYGNGTKLALPIGESGIYFLRIKQGATSEDSFVVRSRTGALVKEGDNEYIFWGQDFSSGRSITDGSLTLYNLEDGQQEIGTATFGSDGIAKTTLLSSADIAVVKRDSDIAVVPINLRYLNIKNYYSQFSEKVRKTKYFLFTDRPLYKPGDTVYFKSILRDDDDARYTIPSGLATVTVYDGNEGNSPVFQKSYAISGDGAVSGDLTLPASAAVGYYSMQIAADGSTVSGYANFDVDFFRKPEYSIDVTSSKTEVISGDKASVTISGSYFSGQPLANQTVTYKIYSGNYYSYEYLMDQAVMLNDDYRYGYFGSDVIAQGEVKLNQQGVAILPLDTRIPAAKAMNQVFSVEASIDNGSGDPSFSRKNILVYAGDYDIYRKDYSSYLTKVNTPLSLPVTLVSHNKTSVSAVSLTVQVHRENWVAHQDPNQKYPTYTLEKENLPDIQARTDNQGNAVFTFTPGKVGSYVFTVSGSDKRGNTIQKELYSYVSSDTESYYFSGNDNELTVQTDKKKYQPTDTAHLTIESATADRDIFLSFDRERVNRYQVVHMDGKRASVDVPLVTTDIPNIYATVSSFSHYYLDSGQTNVSVSTESKELHVQIIPDRKTYGPSDTARVQVKTSDASGNPVSSDVALWGVDKAIYQLVNDSTGKIFDMFWSERYDGTALSHSLESITALNAEMGGGCFAEGTAILMSDHSTKPIEKIKTGDTILTRVSEKSNELVSASVKSTHQAVVPGYFIFNNTLKVTSYHKLFVNNSWQEASHVQIGDRFIDISGKSVPVTSVEWISGKFTVYNLEIEKYNTFFANGIYVHNQKGGGARTVFKDTAYWNPSIHTDASGLASVTFKLPDNLTTWVLASVGSTTDTKVGQSTTEVVVTKDVIVRPILPNILRIGDTLKLSALVQNFTDKDETFTVDLGFDSGEVKNATYSGVLIKAKEMKQLDWEVRPTTARDAAKITVSARSASDSKISDTVVSQLPVRAFGFTDSSAQTGNGEKTFSLKLSPDSISDKSTVTLSLSPTLLGTLPTAMQYLVNYPYGCVEQTTSRSVPALIAKDNPDLFADALDGKNISDILDKGMSRLNSLQLTDGGWPWWFGNSDPFITSYVVEYLLEAKDAGFSIDPNMLRRAQTYLQQDSYYDTTTQKQVAYSRDDIVAKTYGLTLLQSPNRKTHLSDLKGLTPDLLSLAVMANYKNGDTNPQTNGLSLLESMAQSEGDGVFWKAGGKLHFASNDASTAFAVRAILLAHGDQNLAVKAARFLTRNRRFNYWDNTFATVQVIRAIVDLAKSTTETQPNYSYTVLLDGKQIGGGQVTSIGQKIKDLHIPVKNIKKSGSTLSVKPVGNGQLYSTLLVSEYHTDSNAPAVSHGMTVTRTFVNEKGDAYSLAIGDTVDVVITLTGLKTNEKYGVITDELPSGLVPINESFKNEQASSNIGYWYDGLNYSSNDITENGAVLSLYTLNPYQTTYSYKARVVSEGTFIVPPATASLMYSPEVYGRSAVDHLTVTKESTIIPGKLPAQQMKKLTKGLYTSLGLGLIILLGIIVLILRIKGISLLALKDRLLRRTPKSDESQAASQPDQEST